MSDVKHTPTPWEAWQAPDGTWTFRSVYRDEQGRRCTAWPATFKCGAQDDEANARFAATAVNSHARLIEALAWYGEQARLARLIHREGDAGRQALADDGGKRARAVLTQVREGGE